MKWSKLKSGVEECLHEDVEGRLEFHATRYSKAHDGWAFLLRVVFDKETVIEASTDSKQYMYYVNNYELFRDKKNSELKFQRSDIFDSEDFTQAMHEILNLSIEEAISHSGTNYSSYIRALALVDKRFGKRQLEKFRSGRDAYPIVKIFYRLRTGKPLLELNDREQPNFVRRA